MDGIRRNCWSAWTGLCNHVTDLPLLEEDEVQALGPNIKSVNVALRKYWRKNFEQDPIERVYVVYFFESFFDEEDRKSHMHIHLISRSKRIGEVLRWYSEDCSIHAWSIYKAHCDRDFPTEYVTKSEEGKRAVKDLMDYLRTWFGAHR